MNKCKFCHQKKSFTEIQNKKNWGVIIRGLQFLHIHLFEYKSQITRLFFTSNTNWILTIHSLWWGQKTTHKSFKKSNSFFLNTTKLILLVSSYSIFKVTWTHTGIICTCDITVYVRELWKFLLIIVTKWSYFLIHKGQYSKS